MTDLFCYRFSNNIRVMFWGKDKQHHAVLRPGTMFHPSFYNAKHIYLRVLKIPYSRWLKLIKTKHS